MCKLRGIFEVDFLNKLFSKSEVYIKYTSFQKSQEV